MDPCLERVHEEDRPIVRNVVAAIEVLKRGKLFTSWTCQVVKGHYIVEAHVDDVDCEFSARELELLYDISPLRIVSVSINQQGGKLSLRVRISDKNEPLMLTEVQVVHVRKRSRWML
jgi:hypothetical protein